MASKIMGHILLLSAITVLLFSLSDSTPDSCYGIHYRTINDPRRSTGYISSNNTYLCDRTLLKENVWYRFSSEAGGEMPTTKPKHGTCGTFVPIWMNGSHPTIEEGTVARKACANVPYKYPFGCGFSHNIHVRNCSGYYIYQLKTPEHCFHAYCAGSKVFNCSAVPGSCFANRPPHINMPDRFYAFEKSRFQLFINATDPEGYGIHDYDFLSNKTVSSVSIDEEIATISVTQSGKVSLRVTDREYAQSSLHTIHIVALPCSCMNEGKCKSNKSVSTVREDFSNFTCDCVKPYTGRLCEVTPCNNLPCFPGVNCSVMGDGYKCEECPVRFEGDGKNCQLNVSGDMVVVDAELKIISGLKWNDDLLNKTSLFYKDQTAKIVTQITQAYYSTKDFLNVVVVRYRNESVVVEFQVVLKKKINDPLGALKTSAKQNNSGIFTVDANSVKEKENRPPYFSMPHRYYALEDSEFQLVLNATDPEGYPLRYSYLPNATISSISVDPKRKLVKISVKESGRVSLIVIDYGGREDIHTIDFVTISCSCKKGGKCYHHTNVSTKREDFSNFKCDCAKPYTGRLCEDSPCDNLPCFPGVRCFETSGHDGYKCEKCPAGLEGTDGKDCQIIPTDDEVVIGEMKITSGLKWNDDLLNKSSPHFKNETIKIVTEITKAYSDTKNFVVMVVTRYRKGSVVVEFQVVLKEKMNDPLKPLRTRNKFGIFQVDPHSVREENSTEVEGTLNVVSGLEWKDDLLVKSSSYFKTVSFKIAKEINRIYADEKDFVYVFVTGFRKNNLVVEFKLVWRNKPDDPLKKLRSATKNGKLGHMEIDTGSVKEKTTTVSSNDSSYFGLDKAVFIVLVCLVSVLALICIVVCGICIRKKHISIIMLTTHDDHHGFCSNNRGEDSQFQMQKRPSHNQVVDIGCINKRP